MNINIEELKDRILAGGEITRDEALSLIDADLELLSEAANDIRNTFLENDFDMCAVIGVKGGRCSENCSFCAQSSCSTADIETKSLLDTDSILKEACLRAGQGVRHFGLVSSGKRLGKRDVDRLCESVERIKEQSDIIVCASLGLLGEEDFAALKKAGVSRIHNNLETSRNYFPRLCTSHTYDDKLAAINAAKNAGLEICSGGIIGVGEAMEDRIDLAFTLKSLNVQSVPVNMLDPVPGTPLGDMPVLSKEEVRRVIAIFRFILPKAYIRLAAGRDYMEDAGLSCFLSGSNAAITGDMLTVMGVSVEQDLMTIKKLGYEL